MFREKYGDQELDALLHKWWVGVYGGDSKTWGLGLRAFLPIFFQDLVKAKGDIEEAIQLALTYRRARP